MLVPPDAAFANPPIRPRWVSSKAVCQPITSSQRLEKVNKLNGIPALWHTSETRTHPAKAATIRSPSIEPERSMSAVTWGIDRVGGDRRSQIFKMLRGFASA